MPDRVPGIEIAHVLGRRSQKRGPARVKTVCRLPADVPRYCSIEKSNEISERLYSLAGNERVPAEPVERFGGAGGRPGVYMHKAAIRNESGSPGTHRGGLSRVRGTDADQRPAPADDQAVFHEYFRTRGSGIQKDGFRAAD